MMSAATYHQATSYQRQAMPRHSLDWSGQPVTVKHYPGADTICAEREDRFGPATLGELLQPDAGSLPQRIDGDTLSAILHSGYGVTAVRRTSGGAFCYRSAASAGGLYPAEVYCIVHDSKNLPPGVYYYDPEKACLVRIQEWKGAPPQMVDGPPAGCTLVVSGIFFRSAWKYRLRAYRYLLLDAGHLVENLHLATRMAGLEHEILYDFDDRQVGRRLGFDEQREVPLVVVKLFAAKKKKVFSATLRDGSAASPVGGVLPGAPVSPRERVDSGLLEIHRAGVLPSTDAAAAPSRPVVSCDPAWWRELPVAGGAVDELGFDRAVAERRSHRNFVGKPMAGNAFWRLLGMVSSGLSQRGSSIYPHAATLGCGFIAGGHTPLPPGFYLLAGDGRRYGLVVDGAVGGAVASACLEQRWLSAAGLQFIFLSDPAWCDRWYGPRGYRYAMLNAGRVGQLIYLGATALGFGACGIGAFFDSEVSTLLDLPGEETPLYLVGVGTVKRKKTKSLTNTK